MVLMQALFLSSRVHAEHTRKGSKVPYLVHPVEVSLLARKYYPEYGIELEIAGILHDIVEDSIDPEKTRQEIYDTFSSFVYNTVMNLTKVTTKEDGNREARAAIERERLKTRPKSSQALKVCDIYSNCRDIENLDTKFAKVFLNEKLDTLSVLDLVKNSELYKLTERLVLKKMFEI